MLIHNSQHSPLTLSNRSIESLYEELVEQGIIKKVQNVKMSEFEGEYSYLGTTLRQANIEPMPSLSDVRRVVTEFGVLPLGKSVLLQAIEITGINHKGPKTHHFFPRVIPLCSAPIQKTQKASHHRNPIN